MTGAVVVGVGNRHRRDDGVGPAVAAAVGALGLPGVAVVLGEVEPLGLIDAVAGAELAVVVDAALVPAGEPGRIHRREASGPVVPGLGAARSASTHGIGLAEALRLAGALGRAPGRTVVLAVEVADVGSGDGLSAPVAAAVPAAVEAVVAELGGVDSAPGAI